MLRARLGLYLWRLRVTIELLWKLRGLIGFAFMLSVCAWLWWGKNSAEKEVAELELELRQATALIETQNQMISVMEVKSAQAKERAEKALGEAKKAQRVYQGRAQQILIEVPTADDECVATLDLLKEYQR